MSPEREDLSDTLVTDASDPAFWTQDLGVLEEEVRHLPGLLSEVRDSGRFAELPLAPDGVFIPADNSLGVMCRLAEGWALALRLEPHNGVFEVVEAHMRAMTDDAGGLTTSLLRDFAFGALVRNARTAAGARASRISDAAAEQMDHLLAPWRTDARTTRERRDALAYAALAWRYSQLVASGDRSPTARIAEELGMSSVTASQRIREARHAGLLTDTVSGTAGGELTTKAINILEATLTSDPTKSPED